MSVITDFPAIIITGKTNSAREALTDTLLKHWKVTPYDLKVIDTQPTTGIAEVKTAVANLNLIPFNSPYTVLLFPRAESLTIEAQQSLLKVLEEPPPKARLILSVETPALLLVTIVSRCRIIRSDANQADKTDPLEPDKLITLLTASPGRMMKILETEAIDRNRAAIFIKRLVTLICHHPSLKNLTLTANDRLKLMKNSIKATRMLQANLPPTACLETIFLD